MTESLGPDITYSNRKLNLPQFSSKLVVLDLEPVKKRLNIRPYLRRTENCPVPGGSLWPWTPRDRRPISRQQVRVSTKNDRSTSISPSTAGENYQMLKFARSIL